jgi:hypothetical protein
MCSTDASRAISRASGRVVTGGRSQRPHAMASRIVKSPHPPHNGPSLGKAAKPFLDVLAALIARAILEAEQGQDETHESRDLRPKVHRR